MAYVVECLSSKCEALNSSPSSAKKKKNPKPIELTSVIENELRVVGTIF
jgi:hypothetical protein